MLFAASTPRKQEVGYTMQFLPSTEPGFSTLLQPTSVPSPTIAPNFFSPVSISPPSAP